MKYILCYRHNNGGKTYIKQWIAGAGFDGNDLSTKVFFDSDIKNAVKFVTDQTAEAVADFIRECCIRLDGSIFVEEVMD